MATIQPTTDQSEIGRLITADKVEGTPVESTGGDSLGHIQDIMIDKISGHVAYAVLKYGSFLGLGGKLFALPWDVLKYDRQRSAYIVGIPVERLKGAPSFDDVSEDRWPDLGSRDWGDRIHDYYGSRADWYRGAL